MSKIMEYIRKALAIFPIVMAAIRKICGIVKKEEPVAAKKKKAKKKSA